VGNHEDKELTKAHGFLEAEVQQGLTNTALDVIGVGCMYRVVGEQVLSPTTLQIRGAGVQSTAAAVLPPPSSQRAPKSPEAKGVHVAV
jgi:hypothetical protein